jgi:hypothetical protein
MSPGKFKWFLEINDVPSGDVSLIVDEYVAGQVSRALADDADAIKEKLPTATPAGVFGGGLGPELQSHVEKAHAHLVSTLHVMSQGVHGYSAAVSKATTTVLDADDHSQKAIDGVNKALDKSTTDVSTPFSKTPPASPTTTGGPGTPTGTGDPGTPPATGDPGSSTPPAAGTGTSDPSGGQ